MNVLTYSPILGEAHTDAATRRPTVLPVSVPPHACRKNGSRPHGSNMTDAKDAARNSLPGVLSALSFSIASNHF